MILERGGFLKAAETVKPALATKDLIEELTCIWSDGETITAYNDANLGIQVPFKSEFVGGVRGALILGILQNTRAKTIEITQRKDSQAQLKCGRTIVDLALLDTGKAVWSFPKKKRSSDGFKLRDVQRDGLKMALLSVGTATTVPDQLGVTFMVTKSGLQLFSTDSKTITWVKTKVPRDFPLGIGKRVCVPTAFVEQYLRLCDDATRIYLTENAVIAVTGEGVKIFARLVDVSKPVDFMKTVRDNRPDDIDEFEIPGRLRLAIERASVLLANQQQEDVTISVEGEIMRLFAQSPMGKLNDSMKLKGSNVRDVSLRADPSLIKRALPFAERMAFTPRAIWLHGKGFSYLASTIAG